MLGEAVPSDAPPSPFYRLVQRPTVAERSPMCAEMLRRWMLANPKSDVSALVADGAPVVMWTFEQLALTSDDAGPAIVPVPLAAHEALAQCIVIALVQRVPDQRAAGGVRWRARLVGALDTRRAAFRCGKRVRAGASMHGVSLDVACVAVPVTELCVDPSVVSARVRDRQKTAPRIWCPPASWYAKPNATEPKAPSRATREPSTAARAQPSVLAASSDSNMSAPAASDDDASERPLRRRAPTRSSSVGIADSQSSTASPDYDDDDNRESMWWPDPADDASMSASQSDAPRSSLSAALSAAMAIEAPLAKSSASKGNPYRLRTRRMDEAPSLASSAVYVFDFDAEVGLTGDAMWLESNSLERASMARVDWLVARRSGDRQVERAPSSNEEARERHARDRLVRQSLCLASAFDEHVARWWLDAERAELTAQYRALPTDNERQWLMAAAGAPPLGPGDVAEVLLCDVQERRLCATAAAARLALEEAGDGPDEECVRAMLRRVRDRMHAAAGL